MRKTLVRVLLELSAEHPQLVVVTADLGYSVFEPFMQARSQNYINVGIAEANMMGVCAGLAMCGKRPVAYSITPFITIRDLEQVRLDVCYHQLPVILIGAGAGLSYGTLGPTHHGVEDLALMRAMPNLTVTAPADLYELEWILREGFKLGKPLYIRIGRASEPAVYENEKPAIKIGKGVLLRDYGEDFAIIACGNMVRNALQVAQKLNETGKKGKVVSMHTIKPLDEKLVISLGAKMPIFTFEEHTKIGGLGSAVAECLMDAHTMPVQFARFALADAFQKSVGSHEYLRAINGLGVDGLTRRIQEQLSSAMKI